MSIEISSEGRVRRITLDRPEKRNALSAALCAELARALHEADDDPAVGAILLAANGPAFCAGMDLAEVHETVPADLGALHEQIFTTIDRVHKPVIAAVQGAALGGGTGLAANAHIVIASADARFGLPEIRLGLWPVVIFRAVALAVGERRTTELSITGRVFGAKEALEYGLVTEISDAPLDRAAEVAAEVARFSPQAMAAGIGYARQIRGAGWTQAGESGRDMRERLMAADDFRKAAKDFVRK